MSFEVPAPAVNATEAAASAPAVKAPKVELTKEQKIAALRAQIAKIEQRISDIENDVKVAKPKKEVALPEVGATVRFKYGRTTATTQPVEVTGTVLAVRPAVTDGESRSPALVRVQFGEGFDLQVASIFPAQIVG
jgi:hypothetical protein